MTDRPAAAAPPTARRPADRLHLSPRHRTQLEALLREHLPDVEVWAYGSRITGESHDGSDLDLVLRAPDLRKIPVGRLSDLWEALRESTIPFLVEARDWARLPEEFHGEIERDYVVLVEKPLTSGSLADYVVITMGQSPPGEAVVKRSEAEVPPGAPLLNGPTEFGPHHPKPVQFTTTVHRLAHPGDILFCVRGSTGRMNWADQEYAIGRGLAAIRHRTDNALQPFVRAVIEHGIPDLLIEATGSVFTNVSASQLGSLPYPNLTETEQRAVAHALGTLDDKIELNRHMNETLEAMARALFQSWFVDFDPVRAKMEGCDTGLPKDIADLFPDRLVTDSEHGEIPEGWKTMSLGECYNLTMGQSPPGNTYNDHNDGLPFFQGRTDFGVRFPENRKFCTAPTRIAQPGDTLVSVRAPVGDINMAWERCCIGRGVAALRHKSGSSLFTYYSVLAVQKKINFYEHTGTVFGAINRKQFEELTMSEPGGPELVDAFDAYATPVDIRIRSNVSESRTLTALREVALPKLISGAVCLRLLK